MADNNSVWMMGLIVLLSVALVHAQTFETGDNTTVAGCSSHCSLQDSDMSCWNTTLEFYERVLMGQMRYFIAVQINIDQWHRRHDGNYSSDWDRVIASTNASMQQHLDGEDDLLTPDLVSSIVRPLIQRVANQSDHIFTFMPHFRCPLPCGHFFASWRAAFFVSMFINIVLGCIAIPYIKHIARYGTSINIEW